MSQRISLNVRSLLGYTDGSRAGLAQELGVRERQLADWESGAQPPTAEALYCLPVCCGVPMETLLGVEKPERREVTDDIAYSNHTLARR